jgi:hypothetical protein
MLQLRYIHLDPYLCPPAASVDVLVFLNHAWSYCGSKAAFHSASEHVLSRKLSVLEPAASCIGRRDAAYARDSNQGLDSLKTYSFQSLAPQGGSHQNAVRCFRVQQSPRARQQ